VSEPLTINNLLTLQLKQLSDLEVLLNEEQQILQHHDPEALVAINHTKTELLSKIESTDQHLSSSPQFINGKKNGQYSQELQSIERLLDTCKEQNQMNGEIISKSQLSVERMRIALLENNTKSTMTYDSKGKKSGGLSRMNIKA